MNLRVRYGCPAILSVVTQSARCAAWARRPIALDQPGSTYTPMVIGPADIPAVTDPAEARRMPELAVLSVVAHGHGPLAFEVALAAVGALALVEERLRIVYYDAILFGLNDAARARLEETMEARKWEYQSDFARKHFREGELAGLARGKAEGEALGIAHAILQVLASRGVAVSETERQRVLDCADLGRLGVMLRKVAHVASAAELLE